DYTLKGISHLCIERRAEPEQIRRKLVGVAGHSIEQLAALVSCVANLDHGVVPGVELNIETIVLDVAGRMLTEERVERLSYQGLQTLRITNRLGDALGKRVPQQVLRGDAVTAAAGDPGGGGREASGGEV